MKKESKDFLKKIAKNLIYLKFIRAKLFADAIGVSGPYLSRQLNTDRAYAYTLLEYWARCDAKIIISIIDRDGINLLTFRSPDVKEISKKMGVVCRAEILKRYINVAAFAESLNKRRTDVYAILAAKNKASIDHLYDLLEILECKISFLYEL